jgi:mannose-1-phosphate guanylyltransferase
MPLITQAFVLGAGLGTRLRPLTEDLPKPLVPIVQKPLITFALDHLIDIGIDSFVINTHRLPETFARVFPENGYGSASIKLENEPVLLDTGGGIKNIEAHLGTEPFITYSGDLLTDVRLQPLIAEHFDRGNDVTLGLRKTNLGSAIAFQQNRVVDILNRRGVAGNYDFANIAVWSPAIFERIPPGKKVSFIPIIAEWLCQDGKIGGVPLDQGKWFNIGSREEYFEVHRLVASRRWRPDYVQGQDWPEMVHPTAVVDPTVEIRGCSVVGERCRVGAGVLLDDTIVWADAQIASRANLQGCIVRAGKKVSGSHRNIDI